VGAPALQGGKKIRRNLQENLVSAPQHTKCTPRQSKSRFLGHFLPGWGRFWGFRAVFWGWRLKNKKGRQLFWEKKCTPRQKSWLRLWFKSDYRDVWLFSLTYSSHVCTMNLVQTQFVRILRTKIEANSDKSKMLSVGCSGFVKWYENLSHLQCRWML